MALQTEPLTARRRNGGPSTTATVTTDHDGTYYVALQTESLTAKITNDDGTFSVAVTDKALSHAASRTTDTDGTFYVALQTEPLAARVAPGYSVMVEAIDVSSRERSHVLLTRFSTTLPTLLNLAQLCCIADLRVRLYLELALARALTLYELQTAAALKVGVQLLRDFLLRAEQSACDGPSPENACLQQAKASIAAAARMMTLELAQLLSSSSSSDASSDPAGVGLVEEAMVFGDELRQEGMLQAAVLSYMAAAAPAAKQALTPNANWTMAVAGFSGMIAPNDKRSGGVFGPDADKHSLPPRRWTHVAVTASE